MCVCARVCACVVQSVKTAMDKSDSVGRTYVFEWVYSRASVYLWAQGVVTTGENRHTTEELVDVLMRLPHRKEVEVHFCEHAVLHQHSQVRHQELALVLLGGVVQLQMQSWRQTPFLFLDCCQHAVQDLDGDVVALRDVGMARIRVRVPSMGDAPQQVHLHLRRSITGVVAVRHMRHFVGLASAPSMMRLKYLSGYFIARRWRMM